MRVGAVIFAEQYHYKYDAEESELYLPMLHIGGTTAIKRELNALRKGGVAAIAVIAGNQRELLRRHLSHKGVIMVPEGVRMKGAAEAVNWAVDSLMESCDRVMLLPGNLPLIESGAVSALIERAEGTSETVRLRCGDELGWPIVIERDLKCPEGAEVEDWLTGLNAAPLQTDFGGAVLRLESNDQVGQLEQIASEQLSENELRCGVRVTVIRNDVFFGPGMYQLLKAVDRLGSINAACTETGISYSKAWKGINHIEEELGFPVLERKNGGRRGGKSELTAEGREFLSRYGALMADIKSMTQNFFDVYFGDFQ